MPKSCIMLHTNNFSSQKDFKYQFYSLHFFFVPVHKCSKKFYQSAGAERLEIIGLDQGRATIYLNGPKHTIVIMLCARPFSTKQIQLFLLFLAL